MRTMPESASAATTTASGTLPRALNVPDTGSPMSSFFTSPRLPRRYFWKMALSAFTLRPPCTSTDGHSSLATSALKFSTSSFELGEIWFRRSSYSCS